MHGPDAWRQRWQHSAARDVVTTLIFTAVIMGGAYAEAHPRQPSDQIVQGHHVPYTPPGALLLVAAACLVLALRRHYPVTVLITSASAVLVYSLLGYVNGAALVAPAFALFAVARLVSVRRALLAAAITLVVLMAGTAAGNPLGRYGGGFFLLPGLMAAALFGGIAVSNRLAYIASIRARAEDETSRRVGEERLRIARELHDVVAHTMATINVQAGAAAHVLADQPEAAAEALQAIRHASKDGLRELRAILNVLRQADEGDPSEPAPGLAQLDGLIAGAAQAGLPATLSREGQPRPLPAPVDLAAYRIVQESLTNAIRHAGPASASVRLRYGDTELQVEIADTGRGVPAAAAPGGGHGLIGMRERAAAVGGAVQAGAAPGGGYRVLARLPIDARQSGVPAELGQAGPGARS